MKWISVHEELPKQHERVLVVCYNLTNHHQRHVSIADYWGMRDGHRLWSSKKKVTH